MVSEWDLFVREYLSSRVHEYKFGKYLEVQGLIGSQVGFVA